MPAHKYHKKHNITLSPWHTNIGHQAINRYPEKSTYAAVSTTMHCFPEQPYSVRKLAVGPAGTCMHMFPETVDLFQQFKRNEGTATVALLWALLVHAKTKSKSKANKQDTHGQSREYGCLFSTSLSA